MTLPRNSFYVDWIVVVTGTTGEIGYDAIAT